MNDLPTLGVAETTPIMRQPMYSLESLPMMWRNIGAV